MKNNNWYNKIKKHASPFGTDPFGGSHLSDKVQNSPFGYAGGDEHTGYFEPSSGENHPNAYIEKDKDNALIEEQLSEERKKRKKMKMKIKKRKKLSSLTYPTIRRIISCISNDLKNYKNDNLTKKARKLENLFAFMPTKNIRCASLKGDPINKAFQKRYEGFMTLLEKEAIECIQEIVKVAQWGIEGPKLPTWENEDWVVDTYKEIMQSPEPKENNKEERTKKINTLLDATVTISAKNQIEEEIGSGFFIDQKRILTCHHVTYPSGNPSDILTIEYNDKEYKGRVIKTDSTIDVSLIEIDDPNFASKSVLNLGDSDNVAQGEEIYVIGTPLGFENIIAEGIVSSIPTGYSNDEDEKKYIFISTNINPGNSGGPVIEKDTGNVIGIAAAVITATEDVEVGLNAAIPINDAKQKVLV